MTLLRRFFPLLILPLLLAPAVAWPQASVNVSTLDPVYRDIDKLVAHGLIKKIVMGQKPFSRREIARLTKEAMYYWQTKKEKASPGSVDYVETILARLKRDYAEELVQLDALPGEKPAVSAHLIEKAELDLTMTNSPSEAIPPLLPLGGIDAVINPMLDYRQGRRLVQGVNLGLETNHWLRASNYFAMLFKPRFQIGQGPAEDENRFDVLNLYGKFLIKNFEIEVGRDNLFYGQGKDAGLLLSANPRGLDMIKISNDEPFFFPWVFKYMGAQKLSFFYSDLGPEQFFPNSYLVGYKWSMEVNSFFEFGLYLATMSGGEGSPDASFGDRVLDIFPFGQVTGSDQVQIGNKFAGFDLRFRIPPARGMELYLEAA
ncbi:MAG TPA: capsule assembly Wzi family protein, partial [bacterium]|nr:capsule assembly Wzi family protein [bacterium]